jgi:hypothetical protein
MGGASYPLIPLVPWSTGLKRGKLHLITFQSKSDQKGSLFNVYVNYGADETCVKISESEISSMSLKKSAKSSGEGNFR